MHLSLAKRTNSDFQTWSRFSPTFSMLADRWSSPMIGRRVNDNSRWVYSGCDQRDTGSNGTGYSVCFEVHVSAANPLMWRRRHVDKYTNNACVFCYKSKREDNFWTKKKAQEFNRTLWRAKLTANLMTTANLRRSALPQISSTKR